MYLKKSLAIFVLLIIISCSNKEGKKKSYSDNIEKTKINQKVSKNIDTIQLIDDLFILKTFKKCLDYSKINKLRPLDTINLSYKNNKYSNNQIDTLLTIKVNLKDTLNYHLSGKSIFLNGKIFTNKIILKDSLRIGKSIKDIKENNIFQERLNIDVPSGVIWVSDLEGYSNVYIDFEDNIIKKIKLNSKYLD